MANKKRDRWSFDRSAALIVGRFVPHRKGDGRWVIERTNGRFLPVEVHPSLLAKLQEDPKQFGEKYGVYCWVRWNWEEGKAQLTAVAIQRKKLPSTDVYYVQGTVDKVGGTLATVRITPKREGLEPFEVPVLLRKQQVKWLRPGGRVSFHCIRKEAWLHAERVFTPRGQAQEAMPQAS